MTTAGGIIGFCAYQPDTASYATCCAFVPSAGNNNYFVANLSPAIWNALDANTRKLDQTNLDAYKKGIDPQTDLFKRWVCEFGDDPNDSTIGGVFCGKVIPGAD